MPRNLIEHRLVPHDRHLQPGSYLLEAIRSLLITGWDGEALALGFGIAAAIAVVGISLAREPQDEDGAHMSASSTGSWRWRWPAHASTTSSRTRRCCSVADLPAVLLHGVRGRPVARRRRCPASTTRPATARSSRVRAAPVGGVRRGVQRLLDRARLRGRLRAAGCCSRRPPRGGRRRLRARGARRARPSRWSVVTAVALATGMERGRRRARPLRPLRAALLINLAASLWAAGIAMRLRTLQGGPADAGAGVPGPLLRAGLRAGWPTDGLGPHGRSGQPGDRTAQQRARPPGGHTQRRAPRRSRSPSG